MVPSGKKINQQKNSKNLMCRGKRKMQAQAIMRGTHRPQIFFIERG